MSWVIDYFERENGVQPEVFEDELHRLNKKMLGKLLYIQDQLKHCGQQLGGGYIEKCHDYQGLWEIRVIHSNNLIRELCGFDGERIILVHGYVKKVGQPASKQDLKTAFIYWTEYLRTRLVSPAQEDNDE
jgi:phage-related protein